MNEDEEKNIDEISGTQTTTVVGADGKKRRIIARLPRTPEEEEIYITCQILLQNLNLSRRVDTFPDETFLAAHDTIKDLWVAALIPLDILKRNYINYERKLRELNKKEIKMNFNAIETCKAVDDYIKELPEEFKQKMGEIFDDVKKVCLRKDEYVETLEELLKLTMNRNLVERYMARKIKEPEIFDLLFEEYLCMNSFDHPDEQKKEHLKAVYEMNQETYDQNATKIAAYREELGLPNPFSDFKPYV